MSNSYVERILDFYANEARRTGSYLAARQAVISHFKLTAAVADRILGAQR